MALAGVVVVVIMRPAGAIIAPLFASTSPTTARTTSNLTALDEFGLPSCPSKVPIEARQSAYWVRRRRDRAATSSSGSLYGARTSLDIAFFATGIAVVIGVVARADRRASTGARSTPSSRGSPTSCCRCRSCSSPSGSAPPAARAEEGCLGGLIQPGPDAGQPHHRSVQLAVHRAHRPRPDAVAAREGVRRGVPIARATRTRASCSARSCRTWWPRSSCTPR